MNLRIAASSLPARCMADAHQTMVTTSLLTRARRSGLVADVHGKGRCDVTAEVPHAIPHRVGFEREPAERRARDRSRAGAREATGGAIGS